MALEITSSNCTNSGSDYPGSTWGVSFPGWIAGDLIVCHIVNDSYNVSTLSAPSLPGSESWSVIANLHKVGNSVQIWVGYFVAAGSASAATHNFTSNIQERWTATVVKINSGDFDASAPIGEYALSGSGSSTTSISTASFSAGTADGGGVLCAWLGIDQDPITATPSGWTDHAMVDRGGVCGCFSTRGSETTSSESVPAYTWAVAGDEYAACVYVLRSISLEYHLVSWQEVYHVGVTDKTTSYLENYYNISEYHLAGYTEPMVYAFLASFREPYRSTPQHLAFWREFYIAAPEYIRSFNEPYISAAEVMAIWREEWTEQPAILAAWVEPYRVADAALLVSITEPYSLEEMSQLMPVWREPYAMTIGTSLYQRVERVH